MPQQADRSVVIASSGTTSAAFGSGQAGRGSFQLPSTFTGTNCAVHGSNDGVTFTQVQVEGNELATMVVAASNTYSFPVKSFSYRYLRLVVDAQAVLQTITLFTRD